MMMATFVLMMPMSCITDSSRSIDEALEHNDPPTVIANIDTYKHNFLVVLGIELAQLAETLSSAKGGPQRG